MIQQDALYRVQRTHLADTIGGIMDRHIRDQKRIIRAPHGSNMSCKSWQAEAAIRTLMDNSDPGVAERTEDLVVYGWTGESCTKLEIKCRCHYCIAHFANEPDGTLVVQSGKPGGIAMTTDAIAAVIWQSIIKSRAW